MDRVRQLFRSCEHGDVESVKALLDQGVDIDSNDEDGNTAMHVSSANGYELVVRLLIMRGAALDKVNSQGWTALMQASRYGHVGVVSLLLQHKADVSIKTRYGASALTLAGRGGHIQTSLKLIDAGAELNDISCTGCEYTPLLAAALHGHDAVVRFLIDKGCDVNFHNPSTGVTPLMLAALNGHMTTAQILIEKGGDPNLTNVCEKTALEIAKMRGKREVRGYLDRKTTNKPTVSIDDVKPDIIEAAKQGDLQRIQEILNNDINQRDACSPQDGATPLMFAAMTGQLEMAELLLSRGCDINQQDTVSGWTALMQATYHGKKEVAMLLLHNDANVNIQAKNGCTAFDMASLIDDVDTELVRLLASKAMQVNRVDKSKKNWNRSPGNTNTFLPSDFGCDDPPKTGLKGWWNRMSNRFRNLKLGRTFNSSRLGPMPYETSVSVQDLTMSKQPKTQIPMTPQTARVEIKRRQQNAKIPMTSYENMLNETMKTHVMYTLDINPPHSNLSSETLKPVIPPFLPPPSFALDTSEYARRNEWQTPKSVDNDQTLTPRRPTSFHPAKFLPDRSTGNHGNTNPAITNSSPTSSGGASSITAINNKFTTGSSTEVTNGNPPIIIKDYQQSPLYSPSPQMPSTPNTLRYMQHSTPSRLFHPRRKSTSVPAAFRNTSTTTSPNSSTSGSSSITPQPASRKKSSSSKDSTTSTLTPSPSPTPGKVGEEATIALASLREKESCDELSGILKKLSLEEYQPIFEQEEVDMEAFLTLTENDLEELGIAQSHSRRQILSAISELNTGKGKERQQFHDTMTSFQSTLKSRIPESGTENSDLTNWAIQEETDPHVPSAKSRSS
ncbi:hypothetical protein SNE40_007668 [Patella caerulea]|uniref:SAM domain-containing protein n=1 Tax=Patella caerulea TaxID=87958 RepID=A0AAN8Q8K1_PATCE